MLNRGLNEELINQSTLNISYPRLNENSRFSSDVSLKYDQEASLYLSDAIYRVTSGFSYKVKCIPGAVVYVPEGYLTDGASVPNIFQSIINPWGKHGRAAIVHDILCDFATVYIHNKPVLLTNHQIHKVFLEVLKYDQVNDIKTWTMYWAVRCYFFFTNRDDKLPLSPSNRAKIEEIYLERLFLEA